jgi:hypothetical protein
MLVAAVVRDRGCFHRAAALRFACIALLGRYR